MQLIFIPDITGEKIDWKNLAQKKEWIVEPQFSTLLMVKKGSFTLRIDQKKEQQMEWGQLFLLPPGAVCRFMPILYTECILFRVSDALSLMRHFIPSGFWEGKEKNLPDFVSLPFTSVLWEYTRNLKILWKDNRLSDAFHQVKILELFSLLSLSYTETELKRLFFPLLKEEESFSRFIFKTYRKVKTVEELARLSGHSITGFENRFRETFHMPPYKWMMERKKEMIWYELTHSDSPIQELSDTCGFSSPSQMNDFCKKHIGLTPGSIRRRSKS